ncbi:unnamed protein product [marine sediment metagenome]|uniref:Uncharacterized protein n=1 Tax=marine sediment metagenome TaxID=412755 RepID=X1NLP1_9ZZZZ
MKNFVESLGLSELLLELDDTSLKNFKEKVKYIKENDDRIKKILSKKVKILEEKAFSNNDLVFKFLKV